MDMCYDGVLVMPSDCAIVDEEEMMYLDGGASLTKRWWGVSITMSRTESRNA